VGSDVLDAFAVVEAIWCSVDLRGIVVFLPCFFFFFLLPPLDSIKSFPSPRRLSRAGIPAPARILVLEAGPFSGKSLSAFPPELDPLLYFRVCLPLTMRNCSFHKRGGFMRRRCHDLLLPLGFWLGGGFSAPLRGMSSGGTQLSFYLLLFLFGRRYTPLGAVPSPSFKPFFLFSTPTSLGPRWRSGRLSRSL